MQILGDILMYAIYGWWIAVIGLLVAAGFSDGPDRKT